MKIFALQQQFRLKGLRVRAIQSRRNRTVSLHTGRMSRITTLLITWLALCAGFRGASAAATSTQFFVAVNGSDLNDGSESKPFATLEQARRAVRGVKRNADGKIEIVLREGTHFLKKTFELDASDSGTETSPVVYRAYPGEQVTLSGGLRLRLAWTQVGDGLYEATVPDAAELGLAIDQLFMNGARLHLARYPNYQAETSATPRTPAANADWHDPNFPVFGGTSADAISPERVTRWTNPSEAFIHALHEARWGSKHYRVVGVDSAGTLNLQGGWQENRGGGFDPFFRGGYHKQLLFAENVFEELDAPGEFYFDRQTATLHCIPPQGADLARAEFITPRLKELVILSGDETNPVRFVAFDGIRFQHTERIFLEPYERLLRGDWSISRTAAVRMEGAESCTIANSTFSALGGNAVFLSRYNRKHRITGNHFFDLCESALCIVGDPGAVRSPAIEYRHTVPPDQVDLIPGPQNSNYPAQCLVENNLMHDLGLVGKQTAGVLISMAEEISVRHNTIYRIPRAAICVNDGTWGGHLIEFNDAFHTVRETGDHGPFNSWGRDRHWETPGRFGISSDPARAKARSRLDNYKTTLIRNNRFAHSGGHSWGIDLDDGSSNYEVRNNLCLGMGIKLREGFFRTVENNIVIEGFCGFHVWYEGCEDVIRRNIFVSDKPYQFIRVNPAFAKEFDSNLFWNNGSEPVITGIGAPMPLGTWQAKGFDTHSMLADPRFVDPANGDYTVGADSAALRLGFQNFPMNQFGVLKTEFQEIVTKEPRRFAPAPTATAPLRDPTHRAWLGATIKNLTGPGEQSATGMTSETGVLLISVPDTSGAANHGFQKDDVILGLNGSSISTVDELLARWTRSTEGTSVTVYRGQQKVILTINRTGPSQGTNRQ